MNQEKDVQADNLIGGVEKREISIVAYQQEWPALFEKHARYIADAVGENALGIEHIGSTAVPGLAAKPIIDILLIVPDANWEETYVSQLEDKGYVLRVREPEF